MNHTVSERKFRCNTCKDEENREYPCTLTATYQSDNIQKPPTTCPYKGIATVAEWIEVTS